MSIATINARLTKLDAEAEEFRSRKQYELAAGARIAAAELRRFLPEYAASVAMVDRLQRKPADSGRYVINSMTQYRECRFCGPCEVEVEGPIETNALTMSEDVALSFDDEAEQLGWKSGACPHCAWEYKHQLQDENRAEHPTEDAA